MRKVVFGFWVLALTGCQGQIFELDESNFCEKVLLQNDYYDVLDVELPVESDEELCVFRDQEFMDSLRPHRDEQGNQMGIFFSNQGVYEEVFANDRSLLYKLLDNKALDSGDVTWFEHDVFILGSRVFMKDSYNDRIEEIKRADAESFGYIDARYDHIFEDMKNRYYITYYDGGVKKVFTVERSNIDQELAPPALIVGDQLYLNGSPVGSIDEETFELTTGNYELIGFGGSPVIEGYDKNFSYCVTDFSYALGTYEQMELIRRPISSEDNCNLKAGECDFKCEIAFVGDYLSSYDSVLTERGKNESLKDVQPVSKGDFDGFVLISNDDLYQYQHYLAKVDGSSFKNFAAGESYFVDKNYLYCLEEHAWPRRILRKEIEKVDVCTLDKTCSLPVCETRFDKFDSIPTI